MEQQIEVATGIHFHINRVDRTVIKRLGPAAVHTGEVMPVSLDRGMKSFSIGKVTAAHKTDPHLLIAVTKRIELMQSEVTALEEKIAAHTVKKVSATSGPA